MKTRDEKKKGGADKRQLKREWDKNFTYEITEQKWYWEGQMGRERGIRTCRDLR